MEDGARGSFDIFAPSESRIDLKIREAAAITIETKDIQRNGSGNESELHHSASAPQRILSGKRLKSPKRKRDEKKIWRTPYKPPMKHFLPWDERFVLAKPLKPKPLHRDPVDASYKGFPLLPVVTSKPSQLNVTKLLPTRSPSPQQFSPATSPNRHNHHDRPQTASVSSPLRAHESSLMTTTVTEHRRPHTAPVSSLSASIAVMSIAYGSRATSPKLSRPTSPSQPSKLTTSSFSSELKGSPKGILSSSPSSAKRRSSTGSMKAIARQQAKLSIFSTIRNIAHAKGSALRVLSEDLRAEAVWKALMDELRRLGSLIRYEDIFFVGALSTPHRAILALMGFIATIIGIDPAWTNVKKCIEEKMLVMRNFLHEIKPLALHPKKLQRAVAYWDDECLGLVEVEAVSSICIPATHLASWAQYFQVIAHLLVFADARRSYGSVLLPQVTTGTRSSMNFSQSLVPRDRHEKIRLYLNELIDRALNPSDDGNGEDMLHPGSSFFGASIRWEFDHTTAAPPVAADPSSASVVHNNERTQQQSLPPLSPFSVQDHQESQLSPTEGLFDEDDDGVSMSPLDHHHDDHRT